LRFGLGAEADEIDLAAGGFGGEIGGFIERVAGPGIEPGREHHLVLERRAGGSGDRFEGLQGIGDKGAADDDGHGWWLVVVRESGAWRERVLILRGLFSSKECAEFSKGHGGLESLIGERCCR